MRHFMAGIRFVGGTWHNRIVAVRALPTLLITTDAPTEIFVGSGKIPPPPKPELYFLTRFVTEYGTGYSQYVHESSRDTERPLPVLDPTIAQVFDMALRGCYVAMMGRNVGKLQS